jgi:vacuolar-type H+-ATPase subunit F/Vma7
MADVEHKISNGKVAVIGDALLARGMSLGGVKRIFRADTKEEVERAVKEALEDSSIGMIVMNEHLAKKVTDRKLLNTMDSSISPVFVLVAARNEEESEVDVLRRLIIRAVGIDIGKRR